MGRELKRKQAKKNGQNVRDFSKNDNDSEMSMKKLLIILGVVVLIAIILYLFIGIVVTKEIDWFSNDNENEVINEVARISNGEITDIARKHAIELRKSA